MFTLQSHLIDDSYKIKDVYSSKRSSEDDSLLSDFHKLNRKGREAALGAVKGFTFVPEYTNIEDEEAI